MNNLTLKQLTMLLSALLLVLGLVISAGIVYLSEQNQKVELSWNSFQVKFSEKSRLKSSIDSILGYGGMIHEFKNLILQKDTKKFHQVISQIGAANILLEKYNNLPISEGEAAAIVDIQKVLLDYGVAAEKIEHAVVQGLTSRQIDEIVKVDDTLALRGLTILREENVRQNALHGDSISKSLDLGKLQTILGYGGMIHDFNNYVLRSDEKYKIRAKTALSEALAGINEYKNSRNLSDSELLALEDISNTIIAYRKGLEKIQILKKQNKSVEQIISVIKVDDKLALRGLTILDRQINQQIKSQTNDVNMAFARINLIVRVMLIVALALLFIVTIITVWIIVRRIARPIKEMSDVMNSLAEGKLTVELIRYSGNSEISQMARSIEVFKENALKGFEAEDNLMRLNEELTAQLTELQSVREFSDIQTAKALSLAEGLVTARDDALAESNRAESEKERVRAIVDTVSDCIITIDENGLIKTFNRSSQLTFGYSESDVINKNVSMLMPLPYAEEHDGYVDRFLQTGSGTVISAPGEAGKRRELLAKRKDGLIFPIELSIGVSEVGGKRMFTGVVRDISHQKEIERLKQEFVSSVSHELRTPLTAIKGSVGLIASGKLGHSLDEQTQSLIDVTQRNVDRLTSLVNDLLDFEKLEAGSLELILAPVRVADLLTDAVTVNQHYAANRNVRLICVEDNDINERLIFVDGSRIGQVLANFISNAAKFSPANDEVVVGARQKGDRIYFYVSDNGEGIPEEFRDKIFDRFTQADGSNNKKQGGTGLGMAISKAIIENHNGEIGFTSVIGKGTEFYFLLSEYNPS